jgi:structural maintenance of chromosomes protein 6
MLKSSYQRENLQRLKRELNEIEAQFRDYRSNLTRAKQAIVRHDRDEKDFQLRLKRLEDEIDALTTELEQDAVEEGRIDALREELQSAEDQKKVAEESYQASVVELDAKRAQMTNSQKELTAKDKEIGVIEARVGKLDDASNKAASKRQTELREKNAAYERISDRQQDRNRAERAYQTQAAKVETEFIGEATKICQRVNVPAGETVSSLDKKLEKLDRDVSRETRRYVTFFHYDHDEWTAKAMPGSAIGPSLHKMLERPTKLVPLPRVK